MKTKITKQFIKSKKEIGFCRLIATFILFTLIFAPNFLSAQNVDKEKYELKELVILSRHNIRAPLSGNNSTIDRVTTHKWINWTANSSELTLKGGVLETMMGQYFRKWLEDEGLFKDGQCPTTDEVNIYSNSMQRTIATAQYFKTGFFPICTSLNIYHRFSPSRMEPLFEPRLTKVSEAFKAQALKEISAMGGKKGIVGINESLKSSYDIIERITDMKNSSACKNDNMCALDDYNTQLLFELEKEPNMKGTLKIANSIADALILQYYEELDDKKAAFGYDLTSEEWIDVARVKDVYGDVLFAAPIVAVNVAHPLLVYMRNELKAKDRKFTFLVGHDSNICSVANALGVEEYLLPNTIEKKTPIGSKLVFEKWQDKRTKELYVRINLVYQTTDQLRLALPLSLENPPIHFSLKLSGLTADGSGFYKFEDVIHRFEKAIRAYDDIK